MVLKKNPIIGALCIIVCLFATPRSLAADTLLHDDEIVSPCMEYISNTVCKIGISNGVATSTAIVSGNPFAYNQMSNHPEAPAKNWIKLENHPKLD